MADVFVVLQPVMKLKHGTTDRVYVERFDNEYTEHEVLIEHEVVMFDLVSSTISCSCHFWESWGLICHYSLRVLDASSAFRYPFCNRVPLVYIKERWCRDYKRTTGCISAEVDIESRRCANFAQKYEYISLLHEFVTTWLRIMFC
ncbi:hypothetical protein LIER_41064 [Lithospermum erythrorhizon]|uniref:Protein FAR1-RELATED SEQUENCE n=1 Tax=Lithospermum erythrorhizon TaxID=34254 RepID=A0AAV3R3P7_LITER